MKAQLDTDREEEYHQANSRFNRSYGSDFNLLNGRQYYLLYSSVSHPFLYSDEYRPESLRLKGVPYEGIPINYDIYKQQLILQYSNSSGEAKHIIINEEFIDGFTMNNKEFHRLSFPETGSGFLQVLSSGELSFYFTWGKTMFYSPTANSTPYNYTQASRKAFLYKSGQMYPIKSRASFTNAFEKQFHRDINRFLREEEINVKSSTDEAMKRLLDYCIQLTQPPG
jgi:hypothetical protein